MNVYPFIEAEKRGRRNVTRACGRLKVSRAVFYDYLSGPRGETRTTRTWPRTSRPCMSRAGAGTALRGCMLSCAAVGSDMAVSGWPGRRRQAASQGRAAKALEEDHHRGPGGCGPGGPDSCRDFTADASRLNSPLVRGHHLYPHLEGWLFLATVIDIASRRVVGTRWPITCDPTIADALDNAGPTGPVPDPGVVFHSDRGSQDGFKGSSQQCR